MLFIKFMKQQLTRTYAKLTVLGKLLLTLQIASMFVPIIDPNVEEQSLLIFIFFFISVTLYIPISIYLVDEYCSFIIDSIDEPIDDKRFLKIVTPPCAILTTISIISLFIIEKVAIIQLIPFIPMVFIIYGYILMWVDNLTKIKLPKFKLPKFTIKKLFVKDVKHD